MPNRISTTQIFTNAQQHIGAAREREVITAERASTGKQLVRPSQDPAGFMIAAGLKDEMSMTDSIARNASLANQVLSVTENIFVRVQDLVQRTHELALSCSGEGSTPESSRGIIAHEIETIYESALQAMNTRYNNRALLSGFQTQNAPFNIEGDYQGDRGMLDVEVAPGLKVAVNVSAERAIYGEGLQEGTDILGTMQRLIIGLKEGNTEIVHGTLEDLVKANDQLSRIRGEIGARMNQIKAALDTHDVSNIDLTSGIAKIEDADSIKVFSELAKDQSVLQAAISTNNKLLNENPTDIFFK